MDVTRRSFLKIVGLAGLAVPSASLASIEKFNPRDPRILILQKFGKDGDVRFKCETVEDYLFYTKFCCEKFEIMTFDDPYKKQLGIVAYFDKLKEVEIKTRYRGEKGRIELDFYEQPTKLISIDMEIVNKWIKDNNIDDNEFRKMVFMNPMDAKTKKKMKEFQQGFYATHNDAVKDDINTTENNVSLEDIEIDRHQGESYVYKTNTDKVKRNA